jgi:hypothetical protein
MGAAVLFGAVALLALWRGGMLFAPRAAVYEKFDVRLVPIVLGDRERERLNDYPALPDFKAAAISTGTAVSVSGAADAETAKQHALDSCRMRSTRRPNSCVIYAVGMDVVFDRTLMPLPDPRDLRSKPLDQMFDPDDLPLSTDVRDAVKKNGEVPGRKAVLAAGLFAVTTYFGIAGDPLAHAVEHCGFLYQEPCLVLAVDGHLTLRIPRSLTVVGIFLPRTARELSVADRERIGLVYDGDDWRALARGRTGWFPVAGAQSESDAVAAALAACGATDVGCTIYAIGNFRVTGR